jgi:site-specific recombinase XerD
MITIYTALFYYKGNRRIKLTFTPSPSLIESLKILPDFRWSPELKTWHIAFIENHNNYLTKTYMSRYRFVDQQNSHYVKETGGLYVYYQEVISEDRIYLKFDYNRTLIDLVKTMEKPYWHSDLRLWSIKGGRENILLLLKTLYSRKYKPFASQIYHPRRIINNDAQPPDVNKSLPEKFINYMVLKNYSIRSIQAYEHHLRNFLEYWKHEEISDLTSDQFSKYIWHRMSENNYSRSYQNQMINAIKLYYRVMKERILDAEAVPRPRTVKKLPIVLSREEIATILKTIRNQKHRIIIMVIYGTGIRLAETVNLLVNDIDLQRKLIQVRGGKGHKDRIVPLPYPVKTGLLKYMETYRPNHYLFEGMKGGQYSTRSVQNILKSALHRLA